MNDTPSSPGQRGAVRNPQADGGSKHNRQNGTRENRGKPQSSVQHGGQGRVKNPGTDRRLKTNR